MRVALGVCGGIAAYKAAELARALQERGCTVQVIMTEAARAFVQPLTFAALTNQKVITGLWAGSHGNGDEALSSAVEHISVAQDNDILVIAPATADIIGRMAHGLADDFLTTTYLAFTGPVVVAPAMNTNMWGHPATQGNIETLRQRGHVIVEPADGLLACGTVGPGRLAEPAVIAEAVLRAGSKRRKDLEGEVVLVTAGPTAEPLDPVRFITNRSSGKMGFSLAEAASARDARVILVAGPVNLPDPVGVEMIHITTAEEMRKAVLDHLSEATIVIKSAAVADYHVANVSPHKIKKTAARLTLELEPNPDILAELGQMKGSRLLIGFAAETDEMISEARRKLSAKNADMIVGNWVNREGTGFNADQNEVVLVTRTGETIEVPLGSKRDIADIILDHALRLRLALHASAS